MSGPKYQMPYTGDGVHLPASSSRRLGEYEAKAIERTVFGSGRWLPLHPIAAIQSPGAVTLHFHVPVGGLAFDLATVSDPGARGFELAGATITGTPVISGNTVIIPKTGTATAVRYAYTGISGHDAGPVTGPRGCLRDTDPAVSQFDGTPLYNWCVAFSINL